MNWLYYLAEANLYLCVFYIAYCVFLVKETHYQLNRAYLLLSCVASFVLPVLQLSALKPKASEPLGGLSSYTVMQPVDTAVPLTVVNTPTSVVPAALNFSDYLFMAYVAGAVVLIILLALKLYSVFKLTRNEKHEMGSCKMVYLKDTDVAFSFFNYLFIGTRAAGTNTIITHELVHIRQKHSADIMFLELLKIICWFNPCIYLLQSSLKTVHEYIADEQTAATETDAITYSSFLVNNAYGAGGSSITHSFFNYNLLKKRIIMLNQERSGKFTRLKYLMALPVFAGLLCASTLAFSKSYGLIDLSASVVKAASRLIHADQSVVISDTLVTSKGYKYIEKTQTTDRDKFLTVQFFDGDGGNLFGHRLYHYFDESKTFVPFPPDAKTVNRLKQKYGYEFPKIVLPTVAPTSPKPKTDRANNRTPGATVVRLSDVVMARALSEPRKKADKVPTAVIRAKRAEVVTFPAQAPKPRVDSVRFPGKKTVRPTKIDVVRFPPQPPKPKVDRVKFVPKATGNIKTSTKGYQYEEDGYLVRNKQDFRVIIHEKNGEEIDFFKSSATKADIQLLKDKYGYTFPNIKIHDKLPPPPPMPVTQPSPKTSSNQLGQKNGTGGAVVKKGLNNVVYEIPDANAKRRHLPLILVNDQRYTLSKELQERYNNGEHLVVSATDSTVSYVRNTPYAISKWGPDAAEGVISLYGKTSITTIK